MKELDIFNGKKIDSFGGNDLAVNLKKAQTAITELSDDYRIHNHSNSQFSWQRFVLNHHGGLRNIRQITAEINRKRQALNEAQHNYNRKNIEVKVLRKRSESTAEILDKQLIHADIDKLESELILALEPIEGAIKDILTLKKAYDEIMVNYQNYTEADFEREEVEYWIRRLFNQAICDLREFDRITAGNQAAIGQMGLNVSHVEAKLNDYLAKERSSDNPTNTQWREFLEQCVNEYRKHVEQFSGYGGFTGGSLNESLYVSNG
ncbi:MAG: hypothetical protein OES84_00065 [Kiritimatiellaceae bacterium]|nr:hypothetical protein [Kiritimatiellaceae bacterium]